MAHVETCAVHRRLQGDTVCVSISVGQRKARQSSEILAKAQCSRATAKLRRGARRCSLQHHPADAQETRTVGRHLRDERLGRKGRAAEAALRLRPAAAGDGAGVRCRRPAANRLAGVRGTGPWRGRSELDPGCDLSALGGVGVRNSFFSRTDRRSFKSQVTCEKRDKDEKKKHETNANL